MLAVLPKSVHKDAKAALAEIYNAQDREHALTAAKSFSTAYGAKWPKATAKVTDDLDVLLAFYDFPAEHWIHLRTTTPIESTFATVRLRQRDPAAGERSAAPRRDPVEHPAAPAGGTGRREVEPLGRGVDKVRADRDADPLGPAGVLRAGVRADPNAAGSSVGSKLERGRGRELELTGVRRRTALPRFGRPGVECLAGVDRNTRSSSSSSSSSSSIPPNRALRFKCASNDSSGAAAW